MKKGRIFVISAPSGCGKTTIEKQVLKRVKNLVASISVTTRPPRRGEKHKKDYRYVSRKNFLEGVKKGNFLEWENNFGHLYGTPKKFIREKLKKGKDVLLSIDVKGGMNIKKKDPKSILIFIKPPSIKELTKRLKKRNTDKNKEIAKRLKIAKKELTFAPKYDYRVVNRKLDKAVKGVISIIKKERSK